MSKIIDLLKFMVVNMRSLLAYTIVVLSFSFLFMLLKVQIPPANKDIIQISVGLVLAGLGGVCGYYFGSSKDKSDSDKAAAATNSVTISNPTK